MAEMSESIALKLLMEKFKECADAARVYAHASKREEFLTMGHMLEHLQKQAARLAAMGVMKRVTGGH
jgi:hypothetical protein